MALRPQPSLEHDPDSCGIGTSSCGVFPAISGRRGLRSVCVHSCRRRAGVGTMQSSRSHFSMVLRIGALLCCIGARRSDAAAADGTAVALVTPRPVGALEGSFLGVFGRTTAAPHPPSWRGPDEVMGRRGVLPRPPSAPSGAASSTTTSLEYLSDAGSASSGGMDVGGGFGGGGDGARRSPSAEAVASYLNALSSGSIAAPSEGAVSSYLGALSAGRVGAPPTADAIASYLGSVAATEASLSTTPEEEAATGRSSPVPPASGAAFSGDGAPSSHARVSGSRSHLDLIAGACRGDEEAQGEDCRRAVVSYAHAVTIRGAAPSLDVDVIDGAEKQVPKAAIGGEATTSHVPFKPMRPTHAGAAIVEGCYRQVKSEGGRTLYDVLEVSPDATAKDIKTQYVALARLSHPDAVASATRSRTATETNNVDGDADFAEIAAAYRVLSNTRLRIRYDRSLWAESFTRDVGRAADEIGRVAGPPVVDLFRRLMRGTVATASAAMSAATDALRGDQAAGGTRGGGDGASGATGVTGLDPR